MQLHLEEEEGCYSRNGRDARVLGRIAEAVMTGVESEPGKGLVCLGSHCLG